MSTTHALMTAEDLEKTPRADQRHELVRGEHRTMSPAGYEHGEIIGEILWLLRGYAKQHKLGSVTGSETGFLLSRHPDTVRDPDVAFVTKARLDQVGHTRKFFPGAPDLAIEVLSPSDTVEDLNERIADFLNAGTRLVWVVSPRNRTVSVYRPHMPITVLRQTDTLDGLDVIPGFTTPVSALFP